MSAPKVECLPAHAVADAAAVMAAAFAESPSYVDIFRGDAAHRTAALAWLFERNIRAVRRRDPAAARCVLAADGRVDAAFLLAPADARLTRWDMLLAGLGWIPFMFGLDTLRRLLAALAWFDRAAAAAFAPAPRRLVIERLTVRPDVQGRGIGSRCIADAIAQARSRRAVIRLATQEHRNVRLYERMGFETVAASDYVATPHEYSYHSWFMEWKNPDAVDPTE